MHRPCLPREREPLARRPLGRGADESWLCGFQGEPTMKEYQSRPLLVTHVSKRCLAQLALGLLALLSSCSGKANSQTPQSPAPATGTRRGGPGSHSGELGPRCTSWAGCSPGCLLTLPSHPPSLRSFTVARLANDICGECVPRVYAPALAQWTTSKSSCTRLMKGSRTQALLSTLKAVADSSGAERPVEVEGGAN